MNNALLEKFHQIEEKHWWWEGRRALLKYVLAGKRPRKILDIGCGTGETLTFLKKLFPNAKLYGVDFSPIAFAFAKSRGHKHVSLASAGKLPFKTGDFDTILFLDVLEHIKDHQKALIEARRVLRPEGRIVITAPGLAFLWSDHDKNQGHYRRYTRHEIISLAEKAGLKIKFISYFNFFLSPLIIVLRLLSRLPMFKSMASYDNSLNYDIAEVSSMNTLLKTLFVTEISLLKILRYPFGISIAAVLELK